MLRRLVVAVVIFLAIAVVAADRLGVIIASHVVAAKLKTDEGLINRPSVSIAGVPFLTQAFRGDYKDVTVKAADFPVSGMAVTSMTAHLYGVHIPWHDAINTTVSKVPVDRVVGTAFVSFSNINGYLGGASPRGQVISLRAGTGNAFVVLDRVRSGGQGITLEGDGAFTLSGNVIDIAVTDLRVASGPTPSATFIRRILGLLRVRLPLHSMPFRIVLQTVRIGPAGVTVTGNASDVVLGVKPPR